MQINYHLQNPEIVFSNFNKAITISYYDALKFSVEELRIIQDNINRSIMPNSSKIRYFFNSEIKYNTVSEMFTKLKIEQSILTIEECRKNII